MTAAGVIIWLRHRLYNLWHWRERRRVRGCLISWGDQQRRVLDYDPFTRTLTLDDATPRDLIGDGFVIVLDRASYQTPAT